MGQVNLQRSCGCEARGSAGDNSSDPAAQGLFPQEVMGSRAGSCQWRDACRLSEEHLQSSGTLSPLWETPLDLCWSALLCQTWGSCTVLWSGCWRGSA